MLKCFSHYPDNFLDIVRNTDPSTVTQHGLYIRELTHDHHSSPVCPQVISSLPQQTGQDAAHNGQVPSYGHNTGFCRESALFERQNQESKAGQGSSSHSPQVDLAPHTPQQTSALHRSDAPEASVTAQDHQQANKSTPGASHAVQDRQQASNVSAVASLSVPAAQVRDQTSPQVVFKAENSKENIAVATSPGLKQDTASNAPQEAPQSCQEANGQASLQAQSEGDTNQLKGSVSQAKGGAESASQGVWGRGRVTLLGDAAHATVPNGEVDCMHLTTAYMHAPHLALPTSYVPLVNGNDRTTA